jgi:SPP1 family predicted phage head-tail adaptor
MRAGFLDRRVVIERAALVTDDFGQDIETWQPIATVWASKADIRDAERVAAQQVGATVTTRFQMRWSSRVRDISPRDRVVHAGDVYQVVAVKELGRREGLEVTATAEAD